MERLKSIHFPLCILLCFALSQASYAPIATPQRQTYIVHVRLPEGIAADQLQETFYRSFLSAVNPELKFIHAANATTVALERRLKNVGAPSATYMAVVGAPSGVNVRVYPSILRFNSLNQEMKFSVTLTMAGGGSGGASATQGYLKWISSQREVRSPISVTYKM
ncbi:hypothetical protein ZIOFF_024620 [Zingiber officinale]|uniref:Subtilisin-like protease fibronectin type-III domain-containing protein n=1 Tax=Zingiber officinale TaxID=94328 RepID=A0A8J5GYI9_ZINOF|nr:hypothetical protein ZIOFF_024620 [Zingiber officinale]